MSKGSMAVMPGEVGRRPRSTEVEYTDAQIAAMSGPELFAECLRRAVKRTPSDLKAQLEGLLQPATMVAAGGIMAVGLGVAASNPAGWVLSAMTIAGITIGCAPLAWDMLNAAWILRSAKTNDDLDRAASYLADFIINLGFEAFGAFIGKGIQLASNAVAANRRSAFVARRLKVTGEFGANRRSPLVGQRLKVTGEFGAGPRPRARNLMQEARVAEVAHLAGYTIDEVENLALQARMEGRVGIYRICNPKRLMWISKRFPAKPIFVKAKTSKVTGLATCVTPGEEQEALKYGYYVVKKLKGQWTLQAPGGDVIVPSDANWWKSWPVESGQVVDPVSMKPFIGDIDGFDSFSWDEFSELVVHGVERVRGRGRVTDWNNAKIAQSNRMINGRMRRRPANARPMQHGYWFGSDMDPAQAGEVLIILPNGVMLFEESARLAQIYKKLGRARRALGQ